MAIFPPLFGQRQQTAHTTVKGTTDDDYVYPVHNQDVQFKRLIMVCTLRFDHVLDAQKLNDSLVRLLELGDWKKLGGRLRFNSNGKLEVHVPRQYTPQRPAVTFSRHDLSSISIKEHDLAKTLPVPTSSTSIQPTPYNLIDLGTRPDMPKTIGEMVDRDLPQLSVNVTSFQDATLVGISWPHSVMASQGFQAFLHAWSLVVQGKESQVPPLLGATQDVMLSMEEQEPVPSREELLIQKHRLTGVQLFLFTLRYVWAVLWNPPQVKAVFLPKAALERLENVCYDEMTHMSRSTEGPDEDEEAAETKAGPKTESKTALVDPELTILSWFTRLAVADAPANKPLTVVSIVNANQSLSSMLGHSGIYIQNMLGYSFSFLSSKIAKGPLQQFVREHARHVQEQSTQQQCLSFLRAYRRETDGDKPFKLFYGPSDANVMVCNSFVDLNLVQTVDFSAAADVSPSVVQLGKSETVPPGTMTCFYYHIVNNRLGGGPNCIYLLGRDYGGNLWATAALPSTAWEKVEAALKEYAC